MNKKAKEIIQEVCHPEGERLDEQNEPKPRPVRAQQVTTTKPAQSTATPPKQKED